MKSILAQLEPRALHPIFHSEISSSYLLREIFYCNHNIISAFIEHIFNIPVNKIIMVEREKPYPGKGSIDLYIEFETNKKNAILLIEVKVHDYLSATANQIITYYDAAAEKTDQSDVYFIYLTQYNRLSFTALNSGNTFSTPPTVNEFENAAKCIISGKIKHVSWSEFYDFMATYIGQLSDELALMYSLQKHWMQSKMQLDLNANYNEIGERDISHFLGIQADVCTMLPFGYQIAKNKRSIWKIEVSEIDDADLKKIIDFIKLLASSDKINLKLDKSSTPETLQAVKNFICELAQDENSWNLVSFYSTLFNFTHNHPGLQLYGTGVRGFSIRASIINSSEISLCTLWSNKTIEFGLMR